jgi:hypothetical protein
VRISPHPRSRRTVRAALLAAGLAACPFPSPAQDAAAGDSTPDAGSAGAWRALQVPAGGAPAALPLALAAGDRLVIEAEGRVAGAVADSAGGIGAGALVGRFAGGPPFLIGTGSLVWSAPSEGELAFDVMPRAGRRLTGAYTVRVLAIGPRDDPRQRSFPAPSIAFLPRTVGGPFLAVRYADRAGFGLDLKTLKVILDTAAGQRFVLSSGFVTEPAGATLAAPPPDVALPPGVHRVRATIGDALGNVSPAAEIFLDQP